MTIDATFCAVFVDVSHLPWLQSETQKSGTVGRVGVERKQFSHSFFCFIIKGGLVSCRLVTCRLGCSLVAFAHRNLIIAEEKQGGERGNGYRQQDKDDVAIGFIVIEEIMEFHGYEMIFSC